MNQAHRWVHAAFEKQQTVEAPSAENSNAVVVERNPFALSPDQATTTANTSAPSGEVRELPHISEDDVDHEYFRKVSELDRQWDRERARGKRVAF